MLEFHLERFKKKKQKSEERTDLKMMYLGSQKLFSSGFKRQTES